MISYLFVKLKRKIKHQFIIPQISSRGGLRAGGQCQFYGIVHKASTIFTIIYYAKHLQSSHYPRVLSITQLGRKTDNQKYSVHTITPLDQ